MSDQIYASGRTWSKYRASIKTLWSQLETLFPAAFISVFLLSVLYYSGQMVALLRALSGALDNRHLPTSVGYIASRSMVVAWWGYCTLVLWGVSLFISRSEAPKSQALFGLSITARISSKVQWLAIYVLANALILAPVILHSRFNQYNVWVAGNLFVLIGLFAALRFARMVWQFDWITLFGIAAAPALVLIFVLHSLLAVSMAVMILTSSWLFLRQGLPKRVFLSRLTLAAACILVLGSTLMASIELSRIHHAPMLSERTIDLDTVLLSVWWFVPTITICLLSNLPKYISDRLTANLLACVCLALLTLPVVAPDCSYLPYTITAFAALMLALTYILSRSRWNALRRALPLIGVSLMFYGLMRLEPTLVHGNDQQPEARKVALTNGRQSKFHQFYVAWLAARGETPDNHGPLVLVAAAGGGLRAAAHTALSLAAADDVTSGQFGNRVLVVSGVSGGALGMATWVGLRSDNVRTKLITAARRDEGFEERRALQAFYSADFASPVINRLLTHDIPLALLPQWLSDTPLWHLQSDRSEVLANAWQDRWKALLSVYDLDKGQNIFARKVVSLAENTNLPMIVLNTTAAHDGLRAVYSSVPAAFPGARRLDSTESLGRAINDSTRFAVVSPVALACTDGPVATYQPAPPGLACRAGYVPLAVADGGYIDNSGLASISEIIDELKNQEHDDLHNVFVVSISSDGEAGIVHREGTRFVNGNLIAELLAPGYVLDAARSAHTSVFEELVRTKLPQQHLRVWDLSDAYKTMAPIVAKYPPFPSMKFLNDLAASSDFEKRLALPPLGWTVDALTLGGVGFSANTHVGPSKITDCKQAPPELAMLCPP